MKLLITLILSSATFLSLAQFKEPGSESAQQFKDRKILFVEDFMGNEQGRVWFKKHWRFKHEIRYVTAETIAKMVKEKRTDALIMTARTRAEAMVTGSHTEQKEMFVMAVYLSEDIKKAEKHNIDLKKKDEIFKLSTLGKPTSEAGYKFIGQHFYNHLNSAFGKEGNKDFTKIDAKFTTTLSSKTLYIAKSMVGASEAALKAIYGMPLKVVDDVVLEKAIMSNEANVAYVNVFFSDDMFGAAIIVIHASTGKTILECGTDFKKLEYDPNATSSSSKLPFPVAEFKFGEAQAKNLKAEYDKASKKAGKGK
ncbi:MAG: hypothetical protein KDC83_05855 [Flavobacteriales bacterium]|nr:hypothetical protein [Flavobacteriales bacterium]